MVIDREHHLSIHPCIVMIVMEYPTGCDTSIRPKHPSVLLLLSSLKSGINIHPLIHLFIHPRWCMSISSRKYGINIPPPVHPFDSFSILTPPRPSVPLIHSVLHPSIHPMSWIDNDIVPSNYPMNWVDNDTVHPSMHPSIHASNILVTHSSIKSNVIDG